MSPLEASGRFRRPPPSVDALNLVGSRSTHPPQVSSVYSVVLFFPAPPGSASAPSSGTRRRTNASIRSRDFPPRCHASSRYLRYCIANRSKMSPANAAEDTYSQNSGGILGPDDSAAIAPRTTAASRQSPAIHRRVDEIFPECPNNSTAIQEKRSPACSRQPLRNAFASISRFPAGFIRRTESTPPSPVATCNASLPTPMIVPGGSAVEPPE